MEIEQITACTCIAMQATNSDHSVPYGVPTEVKNLYEEDLMFKVVRIIVGIFKSFTVVNFSFEGNERNIQELFWVS